MAFTEGICPNIQEALNNVVADKPSLKRTQLGYLEAIESAVNTAGITKVPIDPGTGKKKKVTLTYLKRFADESQMITAKKSDCGTDVEPTPFEEEVEITTYLGSPGVKFDVAQMRKLCAPDSTYMQEVMMAHIDTFMKSLNKKLLTLQLANFGTFNGGATYKSVALLKGNNGAPNFKGESEVLEYFEDMDVSGKPIVIGAGNLGQYVRQVGIGCCNSDGINLAQAGNLSYFRDRFVEGIMGDNVFVGLVPGTVQLLTYNEYVGSYAQESPTFSHGTITDPKTGITLDIRWHFNDCDGTYSMNLGLWYKLQFIPDDAFAATDELYGYNGSVKFVGVQVDDYGCCA